MLTPEQMEAVGGESDEAFSAFEAALLCASAHALARSDGDVGTVAALRARLNAISARHSGTLQSAVRRDYSAAYAASFAEDVASAGSSVRVAVSFARSEPNAHVAARQAADVAARESARAFGVSEIQRKMVESTANDYVRRVARNAADLARTGAGFNKAVGEAVSAMAREGVTAFEYVRRDGVRVRVPADVYVRQRVRTEVNAKCTRQTLRTAETAGCLVEVSTHAGCRASHAPWEGGLYQLKGEGPHRNFYKATMYVGGPYADWVEGLGGYNCYHQSRCCHGEGDRLYEGDPLEGTGHTREQAYEARRQQRAMENDIRKLKRQKEVLDANGLDAHGVNARLNAKRAELRRHVEEHKAVLKRDRWREQLPGGYNRAVGDRGIMQVSEPLVTKPGSKGGYRVSEKVNTKAFHDAFMATGFPKPVCESAYKAAGRILEKADGTAKEYMVAIDSRTGAIVADNTLREAGDDFSTGFNGEEYGKIAENANGVVTIHVHPGSKPPSYKDCVTAGSYEEIYASIVVCFDGDVWMVKADAKVASDLESAYNLLKTQLAEVAEPQAVKEVLRRSGKRFEYRRLNGG